jgi:thioredoxin family protein
VTESGLKDRFFSGETFTEFLAKPKKYKDLWDALYKRAVVPEAILARSKTLGQPWHLLVLSEEWCGDSINTLPLVARLAEAMPGVDMRILGRDSNSDLMNAHLTGTSRSIPVIMLLDGDYVERGWWGPRPRPLQEWVIKEGLALPKDDRYREVRTWYARDHGVTSLTELLDMMEGAELAAPAG